MSKNEKSETEGEKNAQENETGDCLDPESTLFDPLKALYENTDEVPQSKKVKIYDNLAIYESTLKRCGILQVGSSSKQTIPGQPVKKEEIPKKSNEIIIGRKFLAHQGLVQGKGIKERYKKNIFNRMKEYKGPLSALYNYVEKKIPVTIYTRKEHGVRGEIFGTILLFDKHWNMLIEDAHETWKRRKYKFSENKASLGTAKDCTERLQKLGIVLPLIEAKSLNRKYVQCSQRSKTLAIRGEQVVLVKAINV